jgi:rRNA-processing protein FCF1
MIIKKRVDLDEYIVEIEYDDVTGAIDVYVLDELEGVIESISITNSEESSDESDDNDDPFTDYNISLN